MLRSSETTWVPRCQARPFGYSGMRYFRMWGFKMIVFNPSTISALSAKSPHLQFLSINNISIMFKLHILKHHIPELPNLGGSLHREGTRRGGANKCRKGDDTVGNPHRSYTSSTLPTIRALGCVQVNNN